jgi:hypothetical protein
MTEHAWKKCRLVGSLTAAAKGDAENKPIIALLKHCAAQNQGQDASFSAACKVMPFPKHSQIRVFRNL